MTMKNVLFHWILFIILVPIGFETEKTEKKNTILGNHSYELKFVFHKIFYGNLVIVVVIKLQMST
jgi:hypothetical protein